MTNIRNYFNKMTDKELIDLLANLAENTGCENCPLFNEKCDIENNEFSCQKAITDWSKVEWQDK